jgi:hypothetical protein
VDAKNSSMKKIAIFLAGLAGAVAVVAVGAWLVYAVTGRPPGPILDFVIWGLAMVVGVVIPFRKIFSDPPE